MSNKEPTPDVRPVATGTAGSSHVFIRQDELDALRAERDKYRDALNQIRRGHPLLSGRWLNEFQMGSIAAQALHGSPDDDPGDYENPNPLIAKVEAFAGQLQAWGHAHAAQNILDEVLSGQVKAPDYYTMVRKYASSEAELERLRTKCTELQAALDRHLPVALAADAYVASDYGDITHAYHELVAAVKAWRPKVSEL